MENKVIIWGFLMFFISLLSEHFWIKYLKKKRVAQVQKEYGPSKYIENGKGNTPSMGGVIFFLLAVLGIILHSLSGDSLIRQIELWSLPFIYGLIGFLDDLIKHNRRSSEGFSSLIKLALQLTAGAAWSVWVFSNYGLQLWPGIFLENATVAILILTFFTVGMVNAVNVTDGLDGLAAGAAIISLAAIITMIPLGDELSYILAGSLGIIGGFMWHNAHPARIFMGDVGSHFIAGLLVVLCVYSGYSVFLIPVGFIFGLEILSVCIQLVAIYGFKRKIFLMSPFHHHFEIKGWSENQIVVRFWVIHSTGLVATAFLIRIIFH